jgi:hypothetical protein
VPFFRPAWKHRTFGEKLRSCADLKTGTPNLHLL